jgi:hypothetical protein
MKTVASAPGRKAGALRDNRRLGAVSLRGQISPLGYEDEKNLARIVAGGK